MASKINTVNNNNNMTMKQIMQVWKTNATCPGNDFNKFNEFVFDKYGIDIASDSASFNLSEFYDMNPNVKERKTIKNVLQPEQASLSKKSSKDHKLKHREEKRDRTKKPEAKRASRVHKESLKIKFDREN